MPVSGNFAALKKLQGGLSSGLPGVAAEVARLSSPPISRDAVAKYDAGLYPSGQARKPLKDGSVRRIYKTGKIRRGAVTFIRRSNRMERLGLPSYSIYQNPGYWTPKSDPPDAWTAIVEDAKRVAVRSIFLRKVAGL